jgi:hypothetical protein
MNLGPFHLARATLAGFGFVLLSLRARFLILLANGISEALLQLYLGFLETVYARALSKYRRAEQHDREQRERESEVHNHTSCEKCQGQIHRMPMNSVQWFIEISMNVLPGVSHDQPT